MNLFQALAYFIGEASSNLLRGWRISSLAVATTALSLFIGGALILLGSNLTGAVEKWRADARLVIYLDAEIAPAELEEVRRIASALPLLENQREVDPDQAALRFADRFPDLAGVLGDLDRSPLPASIELESRATEEQVRAWVGRVSDLPGVDEVHDDGAWLESMNAAASVASSLGLLIGGILMVAAAISIASVVRLSTFVYRNEIAAMRLIGATEFFVRGPFVVEGLMQGLLGSFLAVLALWLGYLGLGGLDLPWFVHEALVGFFLTPLEALALMVLGGCAGLTGGVIPLREKTGVFG